MNRVLFFFSFLLCIYVSAQKNDSLEFYYSSYEFQKAVNSVSLESQLPASDFYLLAKSYSKLGQSEEALKAVKKALEQDSLNVTYLNFLGEQQLKLDDKMGAYLIYLQLSILQPNNAYYFKRMGQALTNSPYTSISRAQLFFVFKDSSRTNLNRETLLKARKFLDSLNLPTHVYAAFERAIELNPNDVESKIALIEISLKINNVGRADVLNRSCLEQHPENKKFVMQAINIAYRLRDYKDVVSKCNLYYNIADSNLVVQKLEGIAQFHLNEFEKCIQRLSNVIKVDEDSEVLHYYVGLSYQEIGNNEEAANYLGKAIELGISENIGNYYTRLAIVEEELGNYQKSIQLYKAAYSETKDKILLYHLARNYDTFYKDKNTALKYYQLYLEENDSSNMEYLEYSKDRVNELKVAKHFSLDSL